jgi:hypothetical protein
MTWHIDYFQCEGAVEPNCIALEAALYKVTAAMMPKSKNTVHLWELVNEDFPLLFIVLALSSTSLNQ